MPSSITFSSLKFSQGKPFPLGVSTTMQGTNFALFSKNATKVFLILFNGEESLEIPLDAEKNKTGDVWHIFIKHLPAAFMYAYRLDGPYDEEKGLLYKKDKILSDPYAQLADTPIDWGAERSPEIFNRCVYAPCLYEEFDWEDEKRPHIPIENLIIYEMHVRGFTIHDSSQVQHKGKFLGIIEKIPYLKSLGINAIELLPIFEFDENHYLPNQKEGKRLYNYWGYSPIHFFVPMNRYATSSQIGCSINEFREMVKALHKNGIEVILDVVFNHTEEGNDITHYYNFRGIDNPEYYMLDNKGKYWNFSGCGNTFNCNQYVALQLILSSLRYWVSEMHIDGFRFDEAAILTRGDNFEPMYPSALIKIMKMDSILSKVKLIAEPWDASGLYQQGQFPNFGKWSEWNSQYRDTVRRFVKGDPQQKGIFARRICGSQDLYERWQTPSCSINFITAHDGFTLRDLVTYEKKNNWSNGEENRDGDNNNESCNYGIEGETSDPDIQAIRERQIRNFLLTLFISQGVPMLLMGDEYGHTKYGNNNTWCHDDELNWFLWDKLEENQPLFRFVSFLIQFRKSHSHLLCRSRFLKDSDIDWHGKKTSEPNWQSNENVLACTLKDTSRRDLYIAFNFSHAMQDIEIPPPLLGFSWYRIIDTVYLDTFQEAPIPSQKLIEKYDLAPYSILLAKLFPDNENLQP